MKKQIKTHSNSLIVDINSYNIEIEKQKQRAERFGIELKEISFPGMVPINKRHIYSDNTSLDISNDIFSKDECNKRLKRFNESIINNEWLNNSINILKQVYARELQEPYNKDIQLPSSSIRIPKKDYIQRANCLHLYGIDKLKTEQIFTFFLAFKPKFVEWLDDSSCNVIFNDQETTDLALSSLGNTIEENNDNMSDNEILPSNIIDDGNNNDNDTLLDLSIWKIGLFNDKSIINLPIMMRIGYLNDKRPSFEERLKAYNEKTKNKTINKTNRNRDRSNRKNRHSPYEYAKNKRNKQKKNNKSINKTNTKTIVPKQYKNMIESIIEVKKQ